MVVSVLLSFVLSATAPALKFDTPAGWVSKPPASSSRVAEFTLPKADGDPEDAAVTLYYFGKNMGGNVQANIDRWVTQFAQPDGKPSKDVAKTSSFESNGLKFSTIDLSGTYVAEVTPGSSEHFNKPGFRMRAAVIETPDGPYFARLTGPAKSVARWDASFMAFLKSVKAQEPK